MLIDSYIAWCHVKINIVPNNFETPWLKIGDGTTGEVEVELLELWTGTMDRNGQPCTKNMHYLVFQY